MENFNNFFKINNYKNYLNSYGTELNRNVLKNDFDKFLYENKQSLKYNKDELFKFVKELKNNDSKIYNQEISKIHYDLYMNFNNLN